MNLDKIAKLKDAIETGVVFNTYNLEDSIFLADVIAVCITAENQAKELEKCHAKIADICENVLEYEEEYDDDEDVYKTVIRIESDIFTRIFNK